MENNSLSTVLIHSRMAIIGKHKFDKLGLTSEEISIFLTVKNRTDWPERLQILLADFVEQEIDEEEL